MSTEDAVKEEFEKPTIDVKIEPSRSQAETGKCSKSEENVKEEIKYFQCSTCIFKEKYEYFGRNPSFLKRYLLAEDAYVIEDPFVAPKQSKVIILGAHCIKCRKAVCKDINCSLYFDGTFCIECAKSNIKTFPPVVQEKLNRII